MNPESIRVCLYSPADLNLMIGSSIWVQSVAEVLHAGPSVHLTLPLRSLERRRLLTDQLRRLPRVELVDPRRQRRWVPPAGLTASEVLDLIERMDREEPFGAILLRSFGLCLAAIERPHLRGRLWSMYVLEPERDVEDPVHLAQLAAIAGASRYVVAQSEEMRALLETVVPAARGKTILLPPAIPDIHDTALPSEPPPPVARLFYAGKFHPFYPVSRMIDFTEDLRAEHPALEFHVIGDQFYRSPESRLWADDLERRLRSTPGVVWHGALPRDEVVAVVASGGIALSLWDYAHGPAMNDLVVSTKLLDYCLAGVPVILNRTSAQETILGHDYPLFVQTAGEALPLIRALLDDPDLYSSTARRCRAAASAFAYPQVYDSIAPFLEDRPDRITEIGRRPKLPRSAHRMGLLLDTGTTTIPGPAFDVLRHGLEIDPTAHLVVGVAARAAELPPPSGADPAAVLRDQIPAELDGSVSMRTVADQPNWWRTLGIAIAVGGDGVAGMAMAEASGARIVRLEPGADAADAARRLFERAS